MPKPTRDIAHSICAALRRGIEPEFLKEVSLAPEEEESLRGVYL